MKNVIPFQKELSFDTKVSEITSISLEREFEVNEEEIIGNLLISGDYKSHEVSANVIPFSFKIPFSIALASNINKDSIKLEINDFAYDMEENNKIKVSIELELSGEEKEEEKENTTVLVEPEEVLEMFEKDLDREEKKEEKKEEIKEEEQIILNESSDDNEYCTYHIYIVQESDTLESILSKYQITEEELREYNTFTELPVGDKLIIPHHE